MDISAKVTSKGQITIPKAVREELGLGPGDSVLFRVSEGRAVIAPVPDFLELAGSVPVPAGKEGTPWDEVIRQTRRERARRHH